MRTKLFLLVCLTILLGGCGQSAQETPGAPTAAVAEAPATVTAEATSGAEAEPTTAEVTSEPEQEPDPEPTIEPTEEPAPFPPTPTLLPEPAQTVTTGAAGLPWWNDRVFYEIFVRSFYDSDGDGIGDLQGVISKLDYLNDGDPGTTDDLGITGIWLMPVAESPSYHGYDVVDYKAIEQDYGTNEDFKQLVAEAHARDIKVIVDLVINHTSREHPWFRDARTSGSEHDDWYIWQTEDPAYTGPWGQKVWHPAGGRYYYGVFWEGMPDLNYHNPAVTEATYDVARFWLEEMGVDGFRLDAMKHIVEEGRLQENSPATHAWMQGFYRFVRSVAPDAFTVGEAFGSPSRDVAEYVGDEVSLAFEFKLAEAMLTAARFGGAGTLPDTQRQVLEVYPEGQYATFLTNHDQNRTMTQLRGEVGATRLAASLLLTAPGVPFLYYGEEIGMQGQKPDERIRTPMQWDATAETAGFTTGAPWQPLAEGVEEANVATQSADPASLLSHYRALIHLRQAHPALRAGDFLPVDAGEARGIYSFVRHLPEQTLLVVVNLDEDPVGDYQLTLAEGPLSGTPGAALLLGEGEPAAPAVNGAGGFDGYTPLPTLPPESVTIIQLGG